MKSINTLLSIVIAFLVILTGWQWWRIQQDTAIPDMMKPVMNTIETTESSSPDTPIPTSPTGETSAMTDTPDAAITPDTTGEIVTDQTQAFPETDTPLSIDDTLTQYNNTSYQYGFAVPKNLYYAGFGARDNALHTVALQSDAVPEDFTTSDIRIYYYGKAVLPELNNAHNNRYEDPQGKYVLLLLNGAYSVRIEADNINSDDVLTLVRTIHSSPLITQ